MTSPTRPASILRSRIRPAVCLLFAIAPVALLGACKKTDPEAFKPNTGQIQILNGSGKPGTADVFRNFLTDLGFDVIECGNARDWNYEHTLVIARSSPDRIADGLARVLGTTRVLHLKNASSLAEATVIIGKDYKELMRTWPQTEKK